MSISSVDIQEQGFGTARNGYDMQEVDVFLERVANEIDLMQADFEKQLKAAREEAAAAAGKSAASPEKDAEIRHLKEVIGKLQAQLADQQTNESVISEAFIAAQKSANKIKDDARTEADRILREAESKAHEIVGEAATEKQRIIAEIDRLDKSRTSFVEEYSNLVQHFQDEAKKVFTSAGLSQTTHVEAPKANSDFFKSYAPEPVEEEIPSDIGQVLDSNDTMFGATNNIDIDID